MKLKGTKSFSAAAFESAAKIESLIASLDDELRAMNTALCTGGTGSAAERLAWNILMDAIHAMDALKYKTSVITNAIIQD